MCSIPFRKEFQTGAPPLACLIASLVLEKTFANAEINGMSPGLVGFGTILQVLGFVSPRVNRLARSTLDGAPNMIQSDPF
ncbi:hypothetical protein D3C80_900930 [compost metagenome]